MTHRNRGFYLGLFLTTFVTLTLEVINVRIFSVITWYHLGFFAISVAMLGMTAGALFVYYRPHAFPREMMARGLFKYSLAFGLSIPIAHMLMIHCNPRAVLIWSDLMQLFDLFLMTIYGSVPFFLSGVVVSIALTKTDLPISRVYAVDLLGAAAGCLGAVALMEKMDPTSAAFLLGAITSLGAIGFLHADAIPAPDIKVLRTRAVAMLLMLEMVSFLNSSFYPHLFRIDHSKGEHIGSDVIVDQWNSHSRVVAFPVKLSVLPYWAAGEGAPTEQQYTSFMNIDGQAGTRMMMFDGDLDRLQWAHYDVTCLGHELRGKNGELAVIGVGGGRDILMGLAYDCKHVTAVELNQIFLDAIQIEMAEFAGIAGNEKVTLHHGEGRNYMTRTEERFDLLQMSLIDTWASTNAGALTLSENGLYTVEAWKAFLGVLKPGGVFTVSRWFSPDFPGETARLISLAVGALIETGVENPRERMMLVTRGRVSTLLLSRDPFGAADVERIRSVSERLGFDPLIMPGAPVKSGVLERIVESKTFPELMENTQHATLDLRPPYDSSPFFFNIVKPSSWLTSASVDRKFGGGIIAGNLYAGSTLLALFFCILILILAAIVLPLATLGRSHGLGRAHLTGGLCYFTLIGLGFMLVEIALMQRFSVLLGYPIYSLAVVLCSLILATGLGSLFSDRLFPPGSRKLLLLPVLIFALVVPAALLLQPIIEATIRSSFALRVAAVFAFTLPIGLLLGCCFPAGISLVRRHSEDALPWMWGINGAWGVLGGVIAVIISMTLSISASMIAGGICYLLLPIPMTMLNAGIGSGQSGDGVEI